jgi:hypothetical protein
MLGVDWQPAVPEAGVPFQPFNRRRIGLTKSLDRESFCWHLIRL